MRGSKWPHKRARGPWHLGWDTLSTLERRHIKIHHKCCILVNITHHLLQVTHVYSTLSCCASGKRLSWVIIYECDKQIHSPRLSHPIQMYHQEVAKTPDSYLLISLMQLPTINSCLFHAYGHGLLWFVYMGSCSSLMLNTFKKNILI